MKVGDVLQSRYRLERVIGEGGMGCVYRAEDLQRKTPVAVKVLKPISPDADEQKKFLKHFKKEAKLLQKLAHKGLVKVYDSFDHATDACIVMEFISGLTLADKMASEAKPLNAPLVCTYADQLLELLEYLHTQSPAVLIRDIKPQNIIVDSSGQLKVFDFGIAREAEPGGKTSTSLRGFGSPGFAPPEQYGYASTDERSDLYSLGATLYFLLTNVEPPDAIALATSQSKLDEISKHNNSVDQDLVKLVKMLMALNPFERPESARVARAMLPKPKQTASKSPARTNPLPPTTPLSAQPESSMRLLGGIIGFILVFFFIVVLVAPRPDTNPSPEQRTPARSQPVAAPPPLETATAVPVPPYVSAPQSPSRANRPQAPKPVSRPIETPKPIPNETQRTSPKYSEPGDMLLEYYSLIEKDRLDDAYALRSQRSHSTTSKSEFINTWKPNRAINVLEHSVLSNDGYNARVKLHVLFDEVNGTLDYTALIHLVFEDG